MPPRNRDLHPGRFDIVLYGVKQSPLSSRYTPPHLKKISNIDAHLVRNKGNQYFENNIARHMGGNPAALFNIRTRRIITISYEYTFYNQFDAGFRRTEVKEIDWDAFLEDTFDSLFEDQDDIWQMVYFRPKVDFAWFLKAPYRFLESVVCALAGWSPVLYLEDLLDGYYLTTWKSRMKYAWMRGKREGENMMRWMDGRESAERRPRLKPRPEIPKWHFMTDDQQTWLKPSFPEQPEPVVEAQPGFTVIPTSPEIPDWFAENKNRLSPIQEELEPLSPIWRGFGIDIPQRNTM
ncbi:hypothetical protein TWF106_000625 [Orbilia oligospora]|uniref:Uncharacterized protein n=1 Tax=Orbilia oligospora TaxID=2813651 RepID=A0A6G1M3Q9_ORBOL|nr:hypothetical protein TWF679_000600 [Orbilia oligospora]KAF3206749.1 hypothetical protein TWF106_000625 [Orbilia oligospora]KAF3220183.1 hypothetical protein TWF191_007499 [Orbilia oligospora]KAF3243401.1 hypothetical protein TWF192_008308 [Orbilia oligospora]